MTLIIKKIKKPANGKLHNLLHTKTKHTKHTKHTKKTQNTYIQSKLLPHHISSDTNIDNIDNIICAKHLITRKAHIRKEYYRKNGIHFKKSFVRKSCIKKNKKNKKQYMQTQNIHKPEIYNKKISNKKNISSVHLDTKIILDHDDHYLSKFGYYDIETKTIDERHLALHKVINHFIPIKGIHNTYNYIIHALNARYILQRNTNNKIAMLFKNDKHYISLEYKNLKTV